jgi:MFS family permease
VRSLAYTAVPAASLIGSPLAGWLLGVHWCLLAGWRRLFILEGIPAVVLGIITVFLLNGLACAGALASSRRTRLAVNELRAEQEAKKNVRDYTCPPQKPLQLEMCMTPGADFGFFSGCSKETLFGILALCEADPPCCHFEAFGSVTSDLAPDERLLVLRDRGAARPYALDLGWWPTYHVAHICLALADVGPFSRHANSNN